eukprot:CAMPEP_0179007236 /NCGR_PEP_ID=MMETSP0795-20121207/15039_1 /TAXON_ID=88552 /ORGANISM="Amoebophrya sp., Strain Ameob2" /LENGTH=93 /DNA_ID=CAMNT_0020702169 /DNA_START=147 /DNA_END=424 /DNA_ORIENTATION=-
MGETLTAVISRTEPQAVLVRNSLYFPEARASMICVGLFRAPSVPLDLLRHHVRTTRVRHLEGDDAGEVAGTIPRRFQMAVLLTATRVMGEADT